MIFCFYHAGQSFLLAVVFIEHSIKISGFVLSLPGLILPFVDIGTKFIDFVVEPGCDLLALCYFVFVVAIMVDLGV